MKLDLSLDTTGLEAALDYLEVGVGELRQRAAHKAAVEILDEALTLIPIDTAAAASSSFMYYEGHKVVFGFADDEHAVVNPKSGQLTSEYIQTLHEDLEVIHDNGQAKFLEIPLEKNRAKIADILAEEYTDMFAGYKPKWRGRGKPRGGRK